VDEANETLGFGKFNPLAIVVVVPKGDIPDDVLGTSPIPENNPEDALCP